MCVPRARILDNIDPQFAAFNCFFSFLEETRNSMERARNATSKQLRKGTKLYVFRLVKIPAILSNGQVLKLSKGDSNRNVYTADSEK